MSRNERILELREKSKAYHKAKQDQEVDDTFYFQKNRKPLTRKQMSTRKLKRKSQKVARRRNRSR